MNRLIRIAIRTAIVVAVLLIALSIAALVIFHSAWFHEKVRQRVIAEIEKSTGGRVDLGNFSFDSQRLTFTLGPLTLHGKEPAGDPPLLTVQSVTIGLRIVSMLERKVDLLSARADRPVIHVVFYPDGTTNLPTSPVRSSSNWAEDVINLGVGHYDVDDGILDFDDRVIPINLHGEQLRLRMDFELQRLRYRGELASRRVRAALPQSGALDMDVESAFAFDKSRIEISRLRLATRESQVDLAGALDDVRSPHGTLHVRATASIREVAQRLKLPIGQTGTAKFDGQLAIAFSDWQNFTMAGKVDARALSYSYQRVKIDNASVHASANLTAHKLFLNQLTASARGMDVKGSATLNEWRDLHFEGDFTGLTIADAASFVSDRKMPWNGKIEGSLRADAVVGESKATAASSITISPIQGAPPVEGSADLAYDQAANTLRITGSRLATRATRVEAAGTLGGTLNVHLETTDLDDLLPAIALVDARAPKELPIRLTQGRAEFTGTITGTLENPRARGHVGMKNLAIENHPLDEISADVDSTPRDLHLTNMAATRGTTSVSGSGSYADPNIAATLSVGNAQLQELAKEFEIGQPISGSANATVAVSGTLEQPQAEITAQIDNAAAFDEHLSHINTTLHYSNDRIDIVSAEADAFSGKIQFKGSIHHRAGDFKNATIQFEASAAGLQLARIEHVSKRFPEFDARIDANANGTARSIDNSFALDSINGKTTLRGIVWQTRSFGDLAVAAETRGENLAIHADGKVGDLSLTGQGSWRLTGDEPGSASIDFSHASIATLHSLVMAGGPLASTTIPFEGFVDGAHATVTIALRKPQDFHTALTVNQVQLNAKGSETLRLGVQPQDVVVTNSKPISVDITADEARIRSAEFTARNTNLTVTGAIPFKSANAGLAINGSVNLIILQLFNHDLVARGQAIVQASLRGSLNDPQLSGRMELKGASLYLGDLPNGIDNANGSILFDRNRATLEKLRAETGGGVIDFTGFIGFGSTLVYRLQAVAQKVRVRYPEDVSVTFNATLALNGSSDASTVSGMVTLARASFTPRSDFAQILAQAAHPASAPVAASEYVRGMQFDVRIESDPNFEFQTSLTRNLEAEVDLRLRGSPIRPVLLGSISVNDGEVQMFGNRYTVNRGDIRFVNPLRVDPIFDMDLETKARGVTVNITISGTTQKLNVNYSSDPPMQPRDIIALLAVGRTPTETAGLNSAPTSADTTNLNQAGGSLIGQAISAQLSSKLQRFFGASRVKIDPTLNGVEYLPQARLTIEQQVSQDITLTYITNLNRTQEQIVQIEWDFNKQWSAVATREASGLFGIDFQFRKRFK